MLGVGETYFSAFALALGMSQVRAGLVMTIPLLIGAVLQLVSPAAVQRLGSHRLWVLITVTIQACSFLPLAVAGYVGHAPDWLIFGVAAVYFGAGLAAGPAWTTWVATIIPTEMRARYFARRNRYGQAALLLGILTGGMLLKIGEHFHAGSRAFVALFLVAGATRFVSSRLIARTTEPAPMPADYYQVPVVQLFSRWRRAQGIAVMLFVLLMPASVLMAHPFFTPYVLERLKVDYVAYVFLIGAPYLSRVLSLPLIGQLAHRYGTRRILWVSSGGYVLVCLMWMASGNTAWLVFAQLVGGVAWAAWELGSFLIMLETIGQAERTSIMTGYYVADAGCKTAGSMLGGDILHRMGASSAAYMALFAISLTARVAVMPLLAISRRGRKGRSETSKNTSAVETATATLGRDTTEE